MYRVGLPGWKLAAKLGVPVRLRVNITQDLEANVYVAESPDLDGLIVEGHTLDDIKAEALAAAGTLLEMELHTKAPSDAESAIACSTTSSRSAARQSRGGPTSRPSNGINSLRISDPALSCLSSDATALLMRNCAADPSNKVLSVPG